MFGFGKACCLEFDPGALVYYTDYPGTTYPWVDRWQAFWTLEVALAQNVSDETCSLHHRGPVAGTDLIDETGGEWFANPEEEKSKMNGLAVLIATTIKAGEELAELSQRAVNKIEALLPGCLVTTQVRRYAGDWYMLRFLIGKDCFPMQSRSLMNCRHSDGRRCLCSYG